MRYSTDRVLLTQIWLTRSYFCLVRSEAFTKRVVLGTNSAITVMGPRSPEEEPAPPQIIHRDDSMWSGDWIVRGKLRPGNLKLDHNSFRPANPSVLLLQ
jgi:hypothetical protein